MTAQLVRLDQAVGRDGGLSSRGVLGVRAGVTGRRGGVVGHGCDMAVLLLRSIVRWFGSLVRRTAPNRPAEAAQVTGRCRIAGRRFGGVAAPARCSGSWVRGTSRGVFLLLAGVIRVHRPPAATVGGARPRAGQHGLLRLAHSVPSSSSGTLRLGKARQNLRSGNVPSASSPIRARTSRLGPLHSQAVLGLQAHRNGVRALTG